MTIKFTSYSKQANDEETKKIEFSSILEYEFEQNVHVYRFREPSNNILNQIEIDPIKNRVGIYAGPTTLVLELHKEMKNEYKVDEIRSFYLLVILKELNFINKNELNFDYEIRHEDNSLVSDFKIELNVSE